MTYELWFALAVLVLAIHVFTGFTVAKLRLRSARSAAWKNSSTALPQDFELPVGHTAPDFTYTIGDHVVQMLDPNSHTRDVVAGLDAVAAFALKYVKTDVAGEVTSIWMKGNEAQLQAVGHKFHVLVEHLDKLNAAFDHEVISLLPHTLSYWIRESGIVHFVHSIGSSVHSAGDNLGNFEHIADHSPANALTDAHFPWITLIVSASYEVHRLWGNKTTLSRALGHVVLDITCVWGGIAFGGLLGGATGTLIIGFLAIPGIGWIAAAATAIGSLAGALLGRHGAQKIKHMKFEAMCKEYAHAATELDAVYLQVKSAAEALSLATSITFNARHNEIVNQRDTTLEAVNSDWTHYLDLQIERFGSHLKGTVQIAKCELAGTIDRLNKYPMGLFFLSPHGWELTLRRNRLETSIRTFEAACSLWHDIEQHDVETIRRVLDILTRMDPADLIVYKITPFCKKIADARCSISAGLEVFLQNTQTALQKVLDEFSAASKALDLSVADQLSPSFLHFQGLNEALIKEADMIGKKVKTR